MGPCAYRQASEWMLGVGPGFARIDHEGQVLQRLGAPPQGPSKTALQNDFKGFWERRRFRKLIKII